MTFLLHSFRCLFGSHEPVRDMVNGELRYRCMECFQDLGAILQSENVKILRAPANLSPAVERLTNATTIVPGVSQ